MPYNLKNLIPVPSMASGWSRAATTELGYEGGQSIALTGTASTPEITVNTTASIALVPSHIYYARVYGYQKAKAGGSVGFYWPIAEPNFREGIALGAAGKWNLYSARNSRTSFAAGNYQFRLDYNNNYIAGTMYFDAPMLIDLTICFGLGKEPTQAWCDANIPFFAGELVLRTAEDNQRALSLPPTYRAVTYLQTTGTQYINTGFMHNQNTRVTMAVHPAAQSENAWIFEGRTSTSAARKGVFYYYSSTKAWSSDYPGSRQALTGIAQTAFQTVDYDKNVCTVNDVRVTHTAKTFQSTAALCLMACNTAGTVKGCCKGKLYHCAVYDNGTLIRDFVPCVRTTDNVAGAYDIVGRKFYANAGTGTFGIGAKLGPSSPGNFRQTANALQSVTLAWNAVSGAKGYRLYRGDTLIADTTSTSYTDTGLLPSQSISYTLTAYRADGASDPVSVTGKTAEAFYDVRPVIHAASFSKNPANINESTVLTVSVTDELVILEPIWWYSGEIYSGEV